MTEHTDAPPAGGSAPVPGVVASWDDVASALGELRTWAGLPSYAQIAARLKATRLARGVPAAEAGVSRVTVYDCFRRGRKRVDVDLIVEIASALGASERQAAVWRQAALRAMSPARALRAVPDDAALPAGPDEFVGRTDALDLLTDSTGPVLVTGMAGSGKSALALTAAHRLLESGTVRTALYADLLGAGPEPADPDAVLRGFLRTLGADPHTQDPDTLLAQSLRSGPAVVLLDNAASAEQVGALLPAVGDARTVVISRRAIGGPWAETIALEALDTGHATTLLATRSGRPVRSEGDRRALGELAELAGGLPLALTIVAKRLRTHGDWSLREHLEAYRERLDLLRADADVEGALRVTLDALPAAARRCLLLTAAHPGAEISARAVAAMLAGNEPAAVSSMQLLEEHHLVRPEPDRRWSMHDLVRAFGRRHAVAELSPSQRNRAMEDLLQAYLDDCVAAVAATKPHAVADWFWLTEPPSPMEPEEAAHAWFDREHRNIAAAVAWAAEHRPQLAVRLTAAVTWPLWDRADLDLTMAMHRTAVRAADRTGDPTMRALSRRLLGMTLVRASRFDDASELLADAAARYVENGDERGEITALNGQAIAATMIGRIEDALRMLERIVAFYDALPDTPERADRLSVALANLAVTQSRAGNHAAAIELTERSLQLAVENNWVTRELNAVSNLSELLTEERRFEEAAEAARRALALARSERDEITEIYALTNLSMALAGTGDLTQADEHGEHALTLARTADAPDVLASVLNNRAEQLLTGAGDKDAARSLHTEALAVATEFNLQFDIQRARDALAALETPQVAPTQSGDSPDALVTGA